MSQRHEGGYDRGRLGPQVPSVSLLSRSDALDQSASAIRAASAVCRGAAGNPKQPCPRLAWHLLKSPPRHEERIGDDILHVRGLHQSGRKPTHSEVMGFKDRAKLVFVCGSSEVRGHNVTRVRTHDEVLQPA
jgi:hypothetical protein